MTHNVLPGGVSQTHTQTEFFFSCLSGSHTSSLACASATIAIHEKIVNLWFVRNTTKKKWNAKKNKEKKVK